MDKIKMTTPLVEMDGDEMTRILWKSIKEELLCPFIDLNTEYYDLGLEHRNETDDKVTVDAANANMKYGVAVKCATITPNAARMTEYNLKEMWKSPNGTIRAILDGTVFRAPIIVKGIEPLVKNWHKPITIARHAYGDVYKNVEIKVPGAGKAELVFTGADGEVIKETIHEFKTPGIIQGIHNVDKSIESFARSCFNYALDKKEDLWFATKDTISKKYDHNFKDIFQATKVSAGQPTSARSIVRPIISLSADTLISTALEKLIKTHQHICLVTDKNQITGILTLEDIFEEMVGEIEDEYDFFTAYIRPFGNGVIASAAANMADVYSALNMPVPGQLAKISVEKWTEQKLGRPVQKEDKITTDGLCVTPRKFRRHRVMETVITKAPTV